MENFCLFQTNTRETDRQIDRRRATKIDKYTFIPINFADKQYCDNVLMRVDRFFSCYSIGKSFFISSLFGKVKIFS